MFVELVIPYLQARIERVRRHTGAAFFHHTCGSVFELIPHMLDAGVEILNPIQPRTRHMEPARLKHAFGDRLTFWGAIDTYQVLPYGTPQEVRAEVKQRIDDLGHGGGYVICSVHNIQPEVSPENVLAMFDAADAYGRYPLK